MKYKKIFNLKTAQAKTPVFENAVDSYDPLDSENESKLYKNESSFMTDNVSLDSSSSDSADGEKVDFDDLEGPNLLEEDNKSVEINNREQMHDFLVNAYMDNDGDPGNALDSAWGNVSDILGDSDVASQVKDGFQRFFSMDQDSMNEDEGMSLADDIWNIYSTAVGPEIKPTMVYKESSSVIDDMISRSRESIQRISNYICKNLIKEADSSYTMKKEAQHKSMNNILYFGPESVSVSPFTNDIQSGIHRVEQNKGFGLVLDDIKDLDYEAIWRQNVMDKYTQPYRDEDGNYVGGLINKRFEINRSIDPINNMQLPPGVRRRPYVPELGSTEARMEVARGNKEKLSDPFSFSKLDLSFRDKKKRAE